MKPVLLVVSTLRRTKSAERLALEKGKTVGSLAVTFVVDIDFSRYLTRADLGVFPELRARCEEEILKDHAAKGREAVKSIAEKAKKLGIAVKTSVKVGRFTDKCLEAARKENPALIVTTRSHRPRWVKRFFGSPADDLIAHTGCTVVEA